MLTGLRDRVRIEQPVALVVAHPDDETIAAGGSLYLMRDLLLVHVTDGAPQRLGDAAREGFATPAAYGAAREAELSAALARSGASPKRERLGVPDQEASEHMPAIAARLRALFAAHRIRAVLTHAYEGGHPDHDATALAVHLAGGPAVVEFAGYHAGSGAMQTGTFLPAPKPEDDDLRGGEASVTLTAQETACKAAMLDCFRTQNAILGHFDRAHERFRPAPRYDFTTPPHPGTLNYELWGWPITGVEWRRRAASALEQRCAA